MIPLLAQNQLPLWKAVLVLAIAAFLQVSGVMAQLLVIGGTPRNLGNTSGGSYANFDQYGRYTAMGDSALAWDEIVVTPYNAKINPANSKPDYDVWLWPGHTFLFDASAAESLFFHVEIPHDHKTGTPLAAHVHWAATTTHTGNTAWKLTWMVKDINGTFALGAADTLSARQAGSGTAFQNQYRALGNITMTGITGVSAILVGLLIRDAALNSDTYTGDAAFLDIGFHYQKDAFGSRWETKK